MGKHLPAWSRIIIEALLIEKKKKMQQKMFIWGVFWGFFGSLGTARFVTPFFPAWSWHHKWEELTNKQQKSKAPAAWKLKYFPFLCFELASAKWRTKVRRRKMLFFSLGRSGSKNKWKTSPAWSWGEKGFRGALMHFWGKNPNYRGDTRKAFKKHLIFLTVWASKGF